MTSLLLIKAEAAPEKSDMARSAPVDDRAPHFGAHHAELAASSENGDPDHEVNAEAAGHMRAGDQEALAAHLRGLDTGQRDHVLDHIHPDHWEGLGFRPLDPEGAKAKFADQFGPEGSPEKAKDQEGAPEKVKAGPENPKKGKGGAEKPMAKALFFTTDANNFVRTVRGTEPNRP